MVSSKVDGRTTRVSKGQVVQSFGRMVRTTEETPASALTDRGRDRLTEGVDVTNATNRTSERREIALDYLRRATEDLQTAATQRLYYMGLAREYGCTFLEIANVCGVTDSAVRLALKRAGDA